MLDEHPERRGEDPDCKQGSRSADEEEEKADHHVAPSVHDECAKPRTLFFGPMAEMVPYRACNLRRVSGAGRPWNSNDQPVLGAPLLLRLMNDELFHFLLEVPIGDGCRIEPLEQLIRAANKDLDLARHARGYH